MFTNKYILLTIDVEDWFQVENFKPWILFSTWDQRELRVEKNVHRLLNLFDSIELPSLPASQPPAERRPKATFFVLGWLADRLPNLVREIQSRGHEVASHGCNHDLPDQLSANKLKQDLLESKKHLEDISGAPVFGYRAPSFAINDDILKIIEDAGYLYDSSYNSFNLHGRYGQISLNGSGKKGIACKLSDKFYELAISNVHLGGRVIPIGGGGYFRLIPGPLFRLGIKHVLGKEGAYLFYMHPWEIDPDQPRVEKASVGFKFRHYNNLGKTHSRMRDLIASFNSCNFMTCKEYLISAAG